MRYVILGASASGVNAAKEIRRLDKKGEIILISKDKCIYSRCIMHHFLAGKRTLEQLNFAEEDFEEMFNVSWMKGRECISVEPYYKKVILENKEEVFYDKLLIATGARATLPPIEKLQNAANITGFRDIEDVILLKEIVKTKKNILVLGAGLVGIDCVAGLLEAGASPVLVEREGWMIIRHLDEKAAAIYQEEFEKRGVKQFYGVTITEVFLNDKNEVTQVTLSDGQKISCDFIVVTTGVRANVDFLKGSGIEVNQFGLLYDDMGMTSEEDVYGAGDVSGLNPIWPTTVKESIVAASNMVGIEAQLVDFFVSKATMNFLGIPCMSLGVVNPYGHHYQIETRELPGSYKKIVHKDGKIEGAVLQGDLSYCGVLQQLIALRIDVSKISKSLFDIDYADFFNIEKNFEFFFEDEWF